MARYYFNHRDGDAFIQDDEGVELESLEAAATEAARALADCARDVLPRSIRRELTIEVGDEDKQPLLQTNLIFEVKRLR